MFIVMHIGAVNLAGDMSQMVTCFLRVDVVIVGDIIDSDFGIGMGVQLDMLGGLFSDDIPCMILSGHLGFQDIVTVVQPFFLNISLIN
ncbi:hypothetical protein D3C75_468250 [compost metagenome]